MEGGCGRGLWVLSLSLAPAALAPFVHRTFVPFLPNLFTQAGFHCSFSQSASQCGKKGTELERRPGMRRLIDRSKQSLRWY